MLSSLIFSLIADVCFQNTSYLFITGPDVVKVRAMCVVLPAVHRGASGPTFAGRVSLTGN